MAKGSRTWTRCHSPARRSGGRRGTRSADSMSASSSTSRIRTSAAGCASWVGGWRCAGRRKAVHVGGASSVTRDEQYWFLTYVRSRTRYLRKHFRSDGWRLRRCGCRSHSCRRRSGPSGRDLVRAPGHGPGCAPPASASAVEVADEHPALRVPSGRDETRRAQRRLELRPVRGLDRVGARSDADHHRCPRPGRVRRLALHRVGHDRVAPARLRNQPNRRPFHGLPSRQGRSG